ncbi:hypothetical protein GH741_11260 [Aquibacillus halophilus]|uniref:Uncharacterized protein n=1 Tax=Aquibacillus halophilus TaxID=930132 RepID=A0A6A8DC94_9BACI|nr:hypothetical protein [Aquibacillus halophilus]MRH43258.1 hypothetical protein [Aquibacillus halophilus]
MKNVKTKSFFIASAITFLLLTVAIFLNYNSLEYAKEACVDNNKTPKIEQDFLAFNWSVSCD